jgi:hypothetical protein
MSTQTMDERIKQLEEELNPKIAARYSKQEFLEPLRRYAQLAYYSSIPKSERSDAKALAFNDSPEVTRLKNAHKLGYLSHLTLEELMTTERFVDSGDPFLNRERYFNTYQKYVDGRFSEGIELLDGALVYTKLSVFGASHNVGPHNADIALVQKHAQVLRDTIDATRKIFQSIQEKRYEDIQKKGPERAREYTIPESLMSLATNVAKDLKSS